MSDYVTRLDFQEQVNRLFESMEKDRSEMREWRERAEQRETEFQAKAEAKEKARFLLGVMSSLAAERCFPWRERPEALRQLREDAETIIEEAMR